MNIYALKGHKVRFAFPDNGWDSDKKHASEYLIKNEIYTVDFTSVSGFSTSVKLEEFPNTFFNSVHFEDVESQSEEKDKQHRDYYNYKR